MRAAVVLRFFYGKSLHEIGTSLGGSEDSARMRVNRAILRLRKYFFKRGVTSTTATIAVAIWTNSVQAAPMALAKITTTVALAKGAATSGSTLALVKGALKVMAWTKAKTAIAVGANLSAFRLLHSRETGQSAVTNKNESSRSVTWLAG